MANVETELLKKSRTPTCCRCRNHGFIVPVKGHGGNCKWKECQCEKCYLITERQKIMAAQKALKKQLSNEEVASTSVNEVDNPGAGGSSSSAVGDRGVRSEDNHVSADSSRMAAAASCLVECGARAKRKTVPSRDGEGTAKLAASNVVEKGGPLPLQGSRFSRDPVSSAVSFPNVGPAVLPSECAVSAEYLERASGAGSVYRSNLPPETFPWYPSDIYRYRPSSMHFPINQKSYRGIHMSPPIPFTRGGYRHMPSGSAAYPSSFQMPGSENYRATYYSPPPFLAPRLFPGIYIPRPVLASLPEKTKITDNSPDSQDSGVMSQNTQPSSQENNKTNPKSLNNL